MPPTTKPSPEPDAPRGPAVARVGLRTLDRIADGLDGRLDAEELAQVRADVEHLREVARWAGEPL